MCKLCRTDRVPYQRNEVQPLHYKANLFIETFYDYAGEYPCKVCKDSYTDQANAKYKKYGYYENVDDYITYKLKRFYIDSKTLEKLRILNQRKCFVNEEVYGRRRKKELLRSRAKAKLITEARLKKRTDEEAYLEALSSIRYRKGIRGDIYTVIITRVLIEKENKKEVFRYRTTSLEEAVVARDTFLQKEKENENNIKRCA